MKFLSVLAVALVATAAVAGCGGKSSDDTPAPTRGGGAGGNNTTGAPKVLLANTTLKWAVAGNDGAKDTSAVEAGATKITLTYMVRANGGPVALLNGGFLEVKPKTGPGAGTNQTIPDVNDPMAAANKPYGATKTIDVPTPATGAWTARIGGTGQNIEVVFSVTQTGGGGNTTGNKTGNGTGNSTSAEVYEFVAPMTTGDGAVEWEIPAAAPRE